MAPSGPAQVEQHLDRSAPLQPDAISGQTGGSGRRTLLSPPGYVTVITTGVLWSRTLGS
jgi:hypothetical protein